MEFLPARTVMSTFWLPWNGTDVVVLDPVLTHDVVVLDPTPTTALMAGRIALDAMAFHAGAGRAA